MGQGQQYLSRLPPFFHAYRGFVITLFTRGRYFYAAAENISFGSPAKFELSIGYTVDDQTVPPLAVFG